MAYEVEGLKRNIIYKDKTLTDISDMSIEKIKSIYSNEHPELINAVIIGPKIEELNGEDVATYTFEATAGEKG